MPNSTVPAAAAGLPTRRLFLASGSVGAVFGAVSAAASAAAPAPAGFAELKGLIEKHRSISDALEDALERLEEAQTRFKERVQEIDFTRVCLEDWRFDVEDPARSRAALVSLFNCDLSGLSMSVRHAGSVMLRRFRALWKEAADERLALFDVLAAKVESIRAESGEPEAKLRVDALTEESEAILLEICGWRCGSIEELRVKGKYLLQNEELYINGDQELALLQSLADAPNVEG